MSIKDQLNEEMKVARKSKDVMDGRSISGFRV